MNEPFDVSTVIFALLAVFVVWKLRSVLGTRTGNERPPYDPFEARRRAQEDAQAPAAGAETGNVIRMPGAPPRPGEEPVPEERSASRWAAHVAPGSDAARGLEAIAGADPSFTPETFMVGARAAYEMIVLAFASGDEAALQPLLAPDVFEGFRGAIRAREAEGHKVETTFVGLQSATILDAGLKDLQAHVQLRYESQMITVTRDRAGAVVDGAPGQVSDIVDRWTFARDIRSRDPNWKLVATETGA